MSKRKEEAAGLDLGIGADVKRNQSNIIMYPASHVRHPNGRIQYAREVDGEEPILVLGSSSV